MTELAPGWRVLAFWTPRRLIFPVFLILAVFLIITGRSAGLADPDWWWHLETGRVIWEAKALPGGDPFSWTFKGEKWVLHEWLFQVLLFLLDDLAGHLGVVTATAFLMALAWYIPVATADRMIQRPLVTLAMALALGAGISAVGAPRPHMISLVFFAILLSVVFQAKYAGRCRPLLVVPILMVPWVNMHGGFAIGVVAMAAFAGLEWLNYLKRPSDRRQLVLAASLTGVAVLTLLASALNPDGIAHWRYPFYVANLDLTREIVEWQSIMTAPVRGVWYAAGGLIFFLLLMGSSRQADVTEVLFPSALFLAGLIQARHAPFAGMAMMVFLAPALWRDGIGVPRLSKSAAAFGWVVAVVGLCMPVLFWQSAYSDAIERRVPEDAVSYIEDSNLQGRMLNDYDIGGYLIYRLGAEYPVFIDGRADLYGDDFYTSYAVTLDGTVPLARYFDQWGIDYAILRPGHALTQMLLLRGWRMVFRGETHLVLVPG